MSIAEIIRSRMEPAEPQTAILEFFRANEGKRMDKRFLDKLKVALGREDVRYGHHGNHTNIEWGDYGSGKSEYSVPSGALLVAYDSDGILANSERLLDRNPAYFQARESRNEDRQRALADHQSMEALESLIVAYRSAKSALDEAFKYGSVYNHDSTAILESFGVELR